MADNRLIIGCLHCGKIMILAKQWGADFDICKAPPGIAEWLSEHIMCGPAPGLDGHFKLVDEGGVRWDSKSDDEHRLRPEVQQKALPECGATQFLDEIKTHGCIVVKCLVCQTGYCMHWRLCPKCMIRAALANQAAVDEAQRIAKQGCACKRGGARDPLCFQVHLWRRGS